MIYNSSLINQVFKESLLLKITMKPKPIMRLSIAFVLLLIFTNNGFSQLGNWSFNPSIGGYFTSLKLDRYTQSLGLTSTEKYAEKTSSLSLSIPLNEKLRIETSFYRIAIKTLDEPVDRSWMAGIHFQYNILPSSKLGVIFNAGYALGDLCTCGDAEPYSSLNPNHFLAFGGKLEYPILKKIHLKAGFIGYSPISKMEDFYSWTQPFLGVNYYFMKSYKVPFKARFSKDKIKTTDESKKKYVDSGRKRIWNFGLTSTGTFVTYDGVLSGQNTFDRKYVEMTITPRINYWINQAILIGVQGTFYHFEDNYSSLDKTNAMGLGAQIRLFPLALRDTKNFSGINLGNDGSWDFSPTVGVEVRMSNYAWGEAGKANGDWNYADIQPNVGFVLSFQKKYSFFWNIGPTFNFLNKEKSLPDRGLTFMGFEYNLLERRKK